jgi:hypothetical protein
MQIECHRTLICMECKSNPLYVCPTLLLLTFVHTLLLTFAHTLLLAFAHTLLLAFAHTLLLASAHTLLLTSAHTLLLTFAHTPPPIDVHASDMQAPRKQLATASARSFRHFMTSQQSVGTATSAPGTRPLAAGVPKVRHCLRMLVDQLHVNAVA